MTKGYAARLRLGLAATALAAGVGFCLLADGGTAPVRAAQKEKGESIYTVDPACDYLKGSEPTAATAGKLSPGINSCRACHSGADTGQAKGYVAAYKSNEFVLLNESTTWDEKDIHAASMKCLSDKLGQQMDAILKKYRPDGYSVATAPECLTCHSVDLAPRTPLAEKKHADFATASGGVNCTVCHGLHQTWQFEHFEEPNQKGQSPPWRAKDPAYKFSTGMVDLRNPVVKANLCASCHVGNHAEGKVVTHEMYAAGHPPLPPFELASYMEGEPRHWGYPAELKYFDTVKPDQAWKLFHFNPGKDESYLARHYAVGAVVGLRAEAELLLAEAKRASDAGEILDYARFDCYSCHHELDPAGDRQKRGYDGPPGRPPLRAAAGVPAELVARHAEGIDAGGLKAKAAGFGDKWGALRKAATAKPFGDPAKVLTDAKAMKDWCDAFLKVQSETDAPLYTAAQTERLRAMLHDTATGASSTADPEAAMCLTWASRTLAHEGKLPDDKLKDLAAVVPLNVRRAPFTVDETKKPVQAQYPERMKKIAGFESPKFTDAFTGVFGKPK